MKKTILGIGISLILILWVLWRVEWKLVWGSLGKVHWPYIFLYFFIFLIIQFLRSFRWEILLRPLLPVGQKTLFPITSVGLLALMILPARSGELARPYLLSQKKPIAMSAALATIVVERVLDVLTILVFIILVSFSDILPAWVNRAGYIAMALMGGILLFLILLIGREQWVTNIAEMLFRPFSKRMLEISRNFICSFSLGAKILIHWRVMTNAFILSLALWGGVALLNFIMFFAFAFPVSLTAAFVLVIIVDLGLMIPAAPGFVGSFQFLCVVGLAIFGIGREEALSFSILSHILQILFIVSLGLLFLPGMRISRFSFGERVPSIESPVSKYYPCEKPRL